ncbi:MAG: divergent polysaccharide deacetylase family protein [Candidatus Coatesbacteria bacterium]|nr:divergent polysaccharide deacetylase family protein [Candidatus Coatesbacteria bacterium]
MAIFGLDFLQTRYGRSPVTVELFTWAQNKGLFSSGGRQLRARALRKAVNEALIESGVHRNNLTFQKNVAKDTTDEYEYREFRVSPSVRLESLRALLVEKASREGAGVVAIEKNSRPDANALAVDLGFGRVKRQCLLFVQPTQDKEGGKEGRPRPTPPPQTPQIAPSEAVIGPGESAEVAIVVDDCGYDLSYARRLVQIGCPLTLSILPRTTFASATAEAAHASGLEVMLHLPMEPVRYLDPRVPELEVRCGQTEAEIETLIAEALASVPHVVGVNNHEGSKACADPKPMTAVMSQLKRRGLYFIDSRTTADTVAFSVARNMNVKAAKRDVFLDNENEEHAIEAELKELVALSIGLKKPVLGICHLRETTVEVLEEQLLLLKRDGHRFLFASQVVR